MSTSTTSDGDRDEHVTPRADHAVLEDELRAAAAPNPAALEDRLPALADAVAVAALRDGLAEVSVERHDTPLGPLVLGATTTGLVRVGLPAEDEDEVLDDLAARVSPRIVRGGRPSTTAARRQLDAYFAGAVRGFDVPLDWRLVRGFRRAVLEATAAIPFGSTASYRDMAVAAGSAGAVRAAGTALATNPIPILVPCHRVLRTGGGLGRYRGGEAAKAALLELEGARPGA